MCSSDLATGSPLIASEIVAGTIVSVVYTGTYWQLDGLTNVTTAAPYYAITSQEVSAGVTPSNYGYPANNIIRYGADPTGLNDSTSAIQNAIKVASQNYGEVYVPCGTFNVSTTLTMTTAIVVRGQSMVGSIIKMNSQPTGTKP